MSISKWFVSLVVLALLASSAGAASAQEGQRFVVSIDNVANFRYHDSGVFNTPVGAADPGPLAPGGVYEWTFHALPGDRLSFATMLVQSNDWFFAPNEFGIPLYRDGAKMTGDVTSYVMLWDAGAEGDEIPGQGGNQAPRQSGPDMGPADPMPFVRRVLTPQIPPTGELVRVTLGDAGDYAFRLRIENISGASELPQSLSAGCRRGAHGSRPTLCERQSRFWHGLGRPRRGRRCGDARRGVGGPHRDQHAIGPGGLYGPRVPQSIVRARSAGIRRAGTLGGGWRPNRPGGNAGG